MGVWRDVINLKSGDPEQDLTQFRAELNRKLRHAFDNIAATQFGGTINDLNGTLILSKGGTGQSLTAPVADKLMFYDLSETAVAWLDIGSTLTLTGTELGVTPKLITTFTDTDTLTAALKGFVICNKGTAMTLNLPTITGNTGLEYNILNIGAGTVTIDPNGAETIMGSATVSLYTNESFNILATATEWRETG